MKITKKFTAVTLALIMVISMFAFSPFVAAANIDSANSWAKEGISEAIEKGFVSGDLQNNYTNIITRQEFCRMAVRWLEYASDQSINKILTDRGLIRDYTVFTDTTDPDILAAFALGITSGVGNNQFNPNGQFNREQAATMIMNTVRALGINVSNPAPSGFSDISEAAEWARAGIHYVRAKGIMQGVGNNRFDPLAPYTREQSIITFNRIPVYRVSAISDDPITVLENMFSSTALSSAEHFAPVFDLSAGYPIPGDQGNQGSCTAWAVAYAYRSHQKSLDYLWGKPTTAEKQFSPSYIYNQINGGIDAGSTIINAMRIIMEQGVCTLADMPYDETDYTTQPNAIQRGRALPHKISSYSSIITRDVNEIKSYIMNTGGFALSIPVYSDFYNIGYGNEVYDDTSGFFSGRHAICLVGWDDGKNAFKFINSWGEYWGLDGFGYICYDLVTGGEVYIYGAIMIDEVRNTSSVSIETLPVKLNYNIGDSLDTTGLVLNIKHADGRSEKITNGYICSPTVLNNAGTQKITVNYGGLETTFDVSVTLVAIIDISVRTLPNKTDYFAGDILSTFGLTINVTYSNGTREVVTHNAIDCAPMILDTAGTQVITAKYGGFETTFEVTVTSVFVGEISLNYDERTLKQGRIARLICFVTPINATNQNLTWISSDPSIVTVSDTGIITAVSGGTATITVKTENGKSANCVVTVDPLIPLTGISFKYDDVVVGIGGVVDFPEIEWIPWNATVKSFYARSSNPDVAEVGSFRVWGKSEGTVIITIETVDGRFTASFNVTVSPDVPVEAIIPVSGIYFVFDSVTIAIGENVPHTWEYSLRFTPSNATIQAYYMSSSNTDVAYIEDGGYIVGMSEGTAIITMEAVDGGFIASYTVIVVP